MHRACVRRSLAVACLPLGRCRTRAWHAWRRLSPGPNPNRACGVRAARACGCRAVDLALSVGIFPYVLKLLQTTSQDLRATLVFIWAKILALDKSCQVRTLG